MVIASLATSIILLASWVYPSYLSVAYAGFGLFIRINYLAGNKFHTSFDVCLVYAVITMIVKFFIFFVFLDENTKNFIDFSATEAEITSGFLPYLVADFVVCCICAIGRYDVEGIKRFRTAFIWLSFTCLAALGISFMTVCNLIYILLLLVYFHAILFRLKLLGEVVPVILSVITTIQLLFPLFAKFFVYEDMKKQEKMGFFEFKTWDTMFIIELILIVLCNSLFAFLCIFDEDERLIESNDLTESFLNQSQENSEYLETVLNLKYIIAYLLSVVFLWVWSIIYRGPIGLIAITWIFYSILSTSNVALKKITTYILLPLLIGSFIFNYLPNIALEEFDIHVLIETAFSVTTILLLTTIVYYSKDISSLLYFSGNWYGIIFAYLFKKIYLFSLVVLFLIGLSDINVLHAGLMILCLFFMINTTSINKNWIWLVSYVMAMLYIRYIYSIFHPILGKYIKEDQIKWFGLKDQDSPDQLEFIPYDYLIWVLFVSASLQHQANQIKVKEDENQSKYFIFSTIKTIFDYILSIEIYVIYVTMIFLMFVSKSNFLNFIRVIISCSIFFRQFTVKANLMVNFQKTYPLLVVLEAYSALLLASRYFYQFQKYTGIDVDFPLTGYELYDDNQEWYADISSDWAIFIASILALRNCKDRTKYRKPTQIGLSKRRFYIYFSEPFQYVFLGIIFFTATYCRLGLAMLVYVLLIGLYAMFLGLYLMVKKGKIRSFSYEWHARYALFYFIFTISILGTGLGYFRFLLVDDLIFIRNWFGVLDWTFYIFGFTKQSGESVPLSETYPYLVILFVCMVERHCLEHMKLSYDRNCYIERLNKTCINTLSTEIEDLKQKISSCKVKIFLKSIAESFITAGLMLLAFDKITVISVVYIMAVFFSSCSPDLTSSGLLYAVLIFMVDVQYTLILSNISQDNAGFEPASEKPLQIPWFDYEKWPNSDKARFFNMGVDNYQLKGLFYDMVLLIVSMIYYNYLYSSELEKEEFTKELEKRLQVRIQNDENEDGKSMFKFILEQIKNYFYIFSRLLVTAILLLFVTQGQGLLSVPYIIFCMVFIYKESITMRSDQFWSYSELLSLFIKYIIMDLTLQILVQIPFLMIADDQLSQVFYFFFNDGTDPNFGKNFSESFYKWCNYIGLMKIWKASSQELEKSYITVSSKIYCFTLLFMIYRMMKSKDYNDFNRERLKNIEDKAKVIAKKMTESFNDERIEKNKFYTGSRASFKKELKKLEDNLNKLNKKHQKVLEYSEVSKSKSNMYTLSPNSNNPIIHTERVSVGNDFKPFTTKVDYSLSSRVLDQLVSGINMYLFEDFIDKITPFGRRSSEKTNNYYINIIKAKEKYYRSILSIKNDSFSDEDFDYSDNNPEQVNLNESYEKEIIEYDFVWILYPKLITYFLASQTESLVYCSFFLNHFQYASLESIIFPLSVIGYAMLKYPRPTPKYFRIMMVYAQFIIVLKFLLQIDLIIEIIGNESMRNYNDPLKIGFNKAENTYSLTIFYYILWDVVVIITLLLHQQYLYRVGLQDRIEIEIESLTEAKKRNKIEVKAEDSKKSEFFSNLLLLSKEEKPGKDWYSFTITTQIIILIYIFVFFPKLDGSSVNIQQAFRNNQFNGRMVSALTVQLCLIIIDRYFYIKQTNYAFTQNIQGKVAIYFRIIIHIILILFIHVICFWYFPINGNYESIGSAQCHSENKYDKSRCNNFEINVYIECFYLLFLVYFIFSAKQIKYGMPSFKRNAFPLMRIISPMSLGLFKAYRGTPFLFELRTLIDWASTNTCLTIFQWFKFEDINSQLFINKCTQRSLETKKIGDPIERLEKCYMGVCWIIVILIIILAPLVVFSTMNPIIEYNKVQSINLQVNLVIENREFSIFKVNAVEDIHDITEDEWHNYRFNQISELVSADKEIMQKLTLPKESDFVWDISKPGLKRLCQLLRDLNETKFSSAFFINSQYAFKRNFPESRQKVYIDRKTEIDDIIVKNRLYELICESSGERVEIPRVFYPLIRLPSNVNSVSPTVIDEPTFVSSLVLQYNKRDNFWTAEMKSKSNIIAITLFTLSDRFSKVTLNYSVNSMFVSLVITIGLSMKLVSRGSAYYLSFSDMKKTDYLETLCAGVYVSRMIGDIKKEEELYYELIDILRSSETTKMLTGNLSIQKQKLD